MATMTGKSSPLHVHCSKGYTVIKFSSFPFLLKTLILVSINS